MKKAMKAMLLTVGAIMAFVSCTNDFVNSVSICDINVEKGTTKSSVMDVMTLNKPIFDNIGLKIKKITSLSREEIGSINLSSFINDKSYFPAYKDNTKNLVLVGFDTMMNDTSLIHQQGKQIREYIQAMISSETEYKARRITWSHNGSDFSSIALFDSESNELIYDNILFNVINVYTDNKTKQYIHMGEGPTVIMESVSFYYMDNYYTADGLWSYSGHYENVAYETPTGNTTWREYVYGGYEILSRPMTEYYAPNNSYSRCVFDIEENSNNNAYGLYMVRFGCGFGQYADFLGYQSNFGPSKTNYDTDEGSGYTYGKFITE